MNMFAKIIFRIGARNLLDLLENQFGTLYNYEEDSKKLIEDLMTPIIK